MIKQYKLRFYNFRLLLFLLAISSIGVVLVGTAREDLMLKQLMGVIMGLVIMVSGDQVYFPGSAAEIPGFYIQSLLF